MQNTGSNLSSLHIFFLRDSDPWLMPFLSLPPADGFGQRWTGSRQLGTFPPGRIGDLPCFLCHQALLTPLPVLWTPPACLLSALPSNLSLPLLVILTYTLSSELYLMGHPPSSSSFPVVPAFWMEQMVTEGQQAMSSNLGARPDLVHSEFLLLT